MRVGRLALDRPRLAAADGDLDALGLRLLGLGMRTSSTPLSKVAATAPASTPSGSVSERVNAALERWSR